MKRMNSATAPRKGVLAKVKWVALAIVGVLLIVLLADLTVAGVSVYQLTHPKKAALETLPSEFGLDYYTFELETENGTVYGWKIAAQQPIPDDAEDWVYTTEYSDKTVVLAQNYDRNRELSDLGGLDYVVDLCSAGYNVITFDWTGTGYSDGRKNLFCLDKAEELKAVVRFAAEETGASFLAVQGIGFGCYPAAVAAADCGEVDALILDSCYDDFDEMFFANYEAFAAVSAAPVRKTVEWLLPTTAGDVIRSAALSDPVNRMSGKHVFFIQGELDEVFGVADAQKLLTLAKADNEASLWLVSQAGHLRNRSYDSETYTAKIDEFLTGAYDGKAKA